MDDLFHIFEIFNKIVWLACAIGLIILFIFVLLLYKISNSPHDDMEEKILDSTPADDETRSIAYDQVHWKYFHRPESRANADTTAEPINPSYADESTDNDIGTTIRYRKARC